MNYEKIYNALVEKAKVRGLDKSQHEGYFEIHHILPKCLGGNDEDNNLVMFTAREHYIAHLILAKQFPDIEGLTYAAFMMSGQNKGSRHYSKLRILVSNLNNERNFGKLKVDYTGQKIGRLTVIQYDPDFLRKGKRIPKWECLCDCGNTTHIATPYLKRERILSCGCLLSESSRDKMLGKEKPQYVRDQIAETLKAKYNKPWLLPALTEAGKIKWYNANELFELWILENKPKSMNFTKAYNKLFNTEFTRSYFKTVVKHFIDGWIPLEDEEWIKFSKGV